MDSGRREHSKRLGASVEGKSRNVEPVVKGGGEGGRGKCAVILVIVGEPESHKKKRGSRQALDSGGVKNRAERRVPRGCAGQKKREKSPCRLESSQQKESLVERTSAKQHRQIRPQGDQGLARWA